VASVERRGRRLLILGATFGLVQGIGFGMRTDVALNFAPFFLVLFAAAWWHGGGAWRPRAGCAVAALVVFAAVAAPVLQTYARTSSLWHVVMLGFTAPYDENLNIGFPRPAYTFPYAHNDSYIETVVRAYWSRLHPADPPLTMVTRPYDVACQNYVLRLAANFPGDMMTRAVASVAGIANLPFWLPDGSVPVGLGRPFWKSVYELRGAAFTALYGSGLAVLAAVLVAVGLQSVLAAGVGFVLVWFWGAFPAIEFQGRHIFQFEFVMLAAMAWGGTLLWRFAAAAGSRPAGAGTVVRGDARRRMLAATGAVAVLILTAGSTLVGARAYQIPRARAFVTAYDRTASAPVEATAIPLSAERVRLAVDLFQPTTLRSHVEEVLLKAEFDFERCGHPPAVTPAFHYETAEPWFDAFSRETPLEDLGVAPTRLFLPVYAVVRDWQVVARFAGVDVPAAFARCVRLSRVIDTSALPLLMPVTIAPDWQRKLYQRVRLGSGLGY
jgi:hypothetical protein